MILTEVLFHKNLEKLSLLLILSISFIVTR